MKFLHKVILICCLIAIFSAQRRYGRTRSRWRRRGRTNKNSHKLDLNLRRNWNYWIRHLYSQFQRELIYCKILRKRCSVDYKEIQKVLWQIRKSYYDKSLTRSNLCDKKLDLLKKIKTTFEKGSKVILHKLPSMRNELGGCRYHKWKNSKEYLDVARWAYKIDADKRKYYHDKNMARLQRMRHNNVKIELKKLDTKKIKEILQAGLKGEEKIADKEVKSVEQAMAKEIKDFEQVWEKKYKDEKKEWDKNRAKWHKENRQKSSKLMDFMKNGIKKMEKSGELKKIMNTDTRNRMHSLLNNVKDEKVLKTMKCAIQYRMNQHARKNFKKGSTEAKKFELEQKKNFQRDCDTKQMHNYQDFSQYLKNTQHSMRASDKTQRPGWRTPEEEEGRGMGMLPFILAGLVLVGIGGIVAYMCYKKKVQGTEEENANLQYDMNSI